MSTYSKLPDSVTYPLLFLSFFLGAGSALVSIVYFTAVINIAAAIIAAILAAYGLIMWFIFEFLSERVTPSKDCYIIKTIEDIPGLARRPAASKKK